MKLIINTVYSDKECFFAYFTIEKPTRTLNGNFQNLKLQFAAKN